MLELIQEEEVEEELFVMMLHGLAILVKLICLHKRPCFASY